jgi:aryl-alcohol dehydrogenase-like predicted oxidoreductase
MQMRTLGRTRPLAVPAVGLGCMSMTPIYGTPDPGSAIATIQRAAELGAGFLDTSDAYAGGANEELVGKAIKGIRNKIVLATKFGNVRMPDGSPGANGKPEFVIESCEKSLKRLGVDVIDLFYQHRVDPSVPVEETFGAMSKLVAQGKVRYLGISEAAAATIRRAHGVHPLSAVQTEYSLFTRDVEPEILPTCRELGIGFVAYSPLQRGTLSGTIEGPQSLANNDRRHDHPRFQGNNLANNVKLLGPIKALAEKHGCTPAQIALAWVLSRGDDIVPIPGTSRVARLEENTGAAGVKLSQADLDSLTTAIDAKKVAGTRYPGGQMKTIGI